MSQYEDYMERFYTTFECSICGARTKVQVDSACDRKKLCEKCYKQKYPVEGIL